MTKPRAQCEDYNQLNVKAAKKVVEAAPTTPDDGPSEAVSVIGGEGSAWHMCCMVHVDRS